eukprot:TRINITY_DN2590_c1_g1_i1.p1 TRINITY_DN2590_c1_g1~~TRINITY_DN2590_c1_g1_i1.p1  ORF type:complete len:580 (+),score=170.08 TRINITY_DN2590_c1_g1_i1:82-1821(+)
MTGQLSEYWANRHKKLYADWIEFFLKSKGVDVKIDDLVEDIKDGYVLGAFMECLSGKKMRLDAPKNTWSRFHVLGNLTRLLKFIAGEGIQLTVSPEDIYEGNEVAILGMIWQILKKYNNLNKSDLKEWVELVIGDEISNFGLNWCNGKLFVELLNSLSPGCIDPSFMDAEEYDRISVVFETTKKFEIPTVLDHDDLGETPNENAILIYLSNIRSAFEDHVIKPEVPVEDSSEWKQLYEEAQIELKLLKEEQIDSQKYKKLYEDSLVVIEDKQAIIDKMGDIETLCEKQKQQIEKLKAMKEQTEEMNEYSIQKWSVKFEQSQTLYEETLTKLNGLEDELKKMEQSKIEIQNNLSSAIERLEEKLDESYRNNTNLMEINGKLEGTIEDFKEELKSITYSNTCLAEQLAEVNKYALNQNKRIQEMTFLIQASDNNEFAQLKNELDNIEHENLVLQQRIKELEGVLEQAQSKTKGIIKELDKTTIQISDAPPNLARALSKTQRRTKELVSKTFNLSEKLDILHTKNRELTNLTFELDEKLKESLKKQRNVKELEEQLYFTKMETKRCKRSISDLLGNYENKYE